MALITLFLSFLAGALVLGFGQWLLSLLLDWKRRRDRRVARRLRIVVLVDHRRRSPRRRSFWNDLLRSSEYDLRYRSKVKPLSIADSLHRRTNPGTVLFSDKTDVIIVNWDAMNGDPVYGSDRTYQFLHHYRPDLKEWLLDGGILLVESQGASWAAAADPYNSLAKMFHESHVRLGAEKRMWVRGDRAALHPDHSGDPIVRDFTSSDLELQRGGLWERRSWFPRRLVRAQMASLRFIGRHRNHLYRGWFEGWSADWTPVICPLSEAKVADSSRSLLLYRKVSEHPLDTTPDVGVIVLTTLFIASSELRRLMSNLLALRDDLHAAELTSPQENELPSLPVGSQHGEVV